MGNVQSELKHLLSYEVDLEHCNLGSYERFRSSGPYSMVFFCTIFYVTPVLGNFASFFDC